MGVDAALWQRSFVLAIVLAASIPSGVQHVVSMREQLSTEMFGPSWYQCAKPCLVVSHIAVSATELTRDQLFTGSNVDHCLPTPWCNPYVWIDGDFTTYALARADLFEWVAPLGGMCLICDCNLGK